MVGNIKRGIRTCDICTLAGECLTVRVRGNDVWDDWEQYPQGWLLLIDKECSGGPLLVCSIQCAEKMSTPRSLTDGR